MAIAGRVMAAGAVPWRLGAADYDEAITTLKAESRLALTGSPVATPWDTTLAAKMRDAGLAIHEESLLQVLLGDLRC